MIRQEGLTITSSPAPRQLGPKTKLPSAKSAATVFTPSREAELVERFGCDRSCAQCLGPNIELEGAEWRTAGVFVKQIKIPLALTILAQHVHDYDHLTLVASGAVKVWRDGKVMGEFSAGEALTIKAGIAHGFQALEDDTVIYCIHGEGV